MHQISRQQTVYYEPFDRLKFAFFLKLRKSNMAGALWRKDCISEQVYVMPYFWRISMNRLIYKRAKAFSIEIQTVLPVNYEVSSLMLYYSHTLKIFGYLYLNSKLKLSLSQSTQLASQQNIFLLGALIKSQQIIDKSKPKHIL